MRAAFLFKVSPRDRRAGLRSECSGMKPIDSFFRASCAWRPCHSLDSQLKFFVGYYASSKRGNDFVRCHRKSDLDVLPDWRKRGKSHKLHERQVEPGIILPRDLAIHHHRQRVFIKPFGRLLQLPDIASLQLGGMVTLPNFRRSTFVDLPLNTKPGDRCSHQRHQAAGKSTPKTQPSSPVILRSCPFDRIVAKRSQQAGPQEHAQHNSDADQGAGTVSLWFPHTARLHGRPQVVERYAA